MIFFADDTQNSLGSVVAVWADHMTGRGTVNIAIKQLGGCIVLAYSVIAWGILCSRREGIGVAVQATAMRRHL